MMVDEPVEGSVELESGGLEPGTIRVIIAALAFIALAAIIAEVVVTWIDGPATDALVTVAATAVGGIAGLAVPQRSG